MGTILGHPATSALLAAALFGLSVPASKALLDAQRLSPTVLAGVLYLSAGLGLAGLRPPLALARLPARALARLLAVALVGGVAAPLALTHGLARVEGQVASLLLGLEAPWTAVLAALLFGEHVGRRAAGAVALAGAGAVILAEPWAAAGTRPDPTGLLMVLCATVGWALDNNLSRGLGEHDPVQVASGKGLVAGPLALAVAVASGEALPHDPVAVAGAVAVGILSYGASLALFLRAMAGLGAARAVTLFATGPLFGAAGAWLALGERPGPAVAAAALLLGAAVLVLVRERHEHVHPHEPLDHAHAHRHDPHHLHAHETPEAPDRAHRHSHRHDAARHAHPHTPDLHHDHRHPHPPDPDAPA